jgi:hypothetical protein
MVLGSVGRGDLTMLATLHQAGLLTVILRSQIPNNSQWCLDWYAAYPGGEVSDPVGPPTGKERDVRGGGFDDEAPSCRSALRSYLPPTSSGNSFGFRVALVETR